MVLGGIVAASIGATSVAFGSGGGNSGGSVLVSIVPCRLMDTRPAPDNVGPRATPIGANSTYMADVWGTNGNCTIPADATGVSANVTAVNGTASSFLTVFPADADRPFASNLNWITGAAPVPNKVDVKLSTTGKVAIYNLAGTVDVVVDIVGYFEPAPVGAGAKGDNGSPGLQGLQGSRASRASRASKGSRACQVRTARMASTVKTAPTAKTEPTASTAPTATTEPGTTAQRRRRQSPHRRHQRRDGTNGIDGTNGEDGTDGINGTNGIDGKTARTAPTGSTAPTASTAGSAPGDPGEKGEKGDPGAPGAPRPTPAHPGRTGKKRDQRRQRLPDRDRHPERHPWQSESVLHPQLPGGQEGRRRRLHVVGPRGARDGATSTDRLPTDRAGS